MTRDEPTSSLQPGTPEAPAKPVSTGSAARLGMLINNERLLVDLAEAGAAMQGWLAAPPPDLRAVMASWAEARGIEVD